MNKKIVRKILVVLMVIAVIAGIVFIFKSKPTKNEYKTTVNFENRSTYNQQKYADPRTEENIEENIIEYTHNNYLPLVFTSFGAFILLLAFYAFLSRKKGW